MALFDSTLGERSRVTWGRLCAYILRKGLPDQQQNRDREILLSDSADIGRNSVRNRDRGVRREFQEARIGGDTARENGGVPVSNVPVHHIFLREHRTRNCLVAREQCSSVNISPAHLLSE